MAKEKKWWENQIEETEKIRKAHLHHTYEDLLKGVEFSKDKGYTFYFGDISHHFDVHGWGGEVTWLMEIPTSLTWICTDTRVGVFVIYMEVLENQWELVGVREQQFRKSDSYFYFLDLKYPKEIRQRLLNMLESPEYSTLDLKSKVFKE